MAKPKDRTKSPSERALEEKMRKTPVHNKVLAKSAGRFVVKDEVKPVSTRTNLVVRPHSSNKMAGKAKIAVAMFGKAKESKPVHAGQPTLSTSQKFQEQGFRIMPDGSIPGSSLRLSPEDLAVLASVRNKKQTTAPTPSVKFTL